MALVRRQWLCTGCLHEPPVGGRSNREEVVSALRAGEAERVACPLRRAARAARHATVVARAVGYGLLAAWAAHSPAGMAVLTGVLIGDALTWVLTSWVALVRGHGHFWIELALFLAIGAWWTHHGGLELPADTEGRATVMFVGMALFSGKAIAFALKLLHRET